MEDVDIGTVAQLLLDLLLGARLIADQADDQVLGVLRELLEELEL